LEQEGVGKVSPGEEHNNTTPNPLYLIPVYKP
jgi:hypothetical protein